MSQLSIHAFDSSFAAHLLLEILSVAERNNSIGAAAGNYLSALAPMTARTLVLVVHHNSREVKQWDGKK